MDHAHENLYAAIDDAFDGMERKLKEFSREMQGEVKTDVGSERAMVDKLAALARSDRHDHHGQ